MHTIMVWVLAGTTFTLAPMRVTSEIGWVDAAVDVGGFTQIALVTWWIVIRMRDTPRSVDPVGPV